MFKIFGFGRKTAAAAAQADAPQSELGLTQQHTDIQQEVVRVVLKDTLRMHGIPTAWVGCEVTVMSRRSGTEALLVHLIFLKWNESLLRFAPALQQQLMVGLDRFEPAVDHSRYRVSWRFAPDCGCPYTALPDPSFWLPSAPVAKAPTPAAAVAPKPKFDLPRSSLDAAPSGPSAAFAPTEPSPLR